MRQVLGAFILALPILSALGYLVREEGWELAAWVGCAIVFVGGCLILGSYLCGIN